MIYSTIRYGKIFYQKSSGARRARRARLYQKNSKRARRARCARLRKARKVRKVNDTTAGQCHALVGVCVRLLWGPSKGYVRLYRDPRRAV